MERMGVKISAARARCGPMKCSTLPLHPFASNGTRRPRVTSREKYANFNFGAPADAVRSKPASTSTARSGSSILRAQDDETRDNGMRLFIAVLRVAAATPRDA
jgi:hypothetical protein